MVGVEDGFGWGFADAAEYLYFFDGWLASTIGEGISADRREPTAEMGEQYLCEDYLPIM